MNCVLMFTGWGGRIMGAKPSHIQEALSSRDCKVHIFNDTKQKLFLHGADGYRGTKKLQEHLQDIVLESSYTVALTSSGGGYAGIRYCIDAGVDCIVGFSVFTTADEAARAADPRGRKAIPIVDSVLPTDEEKNLRFFLQKKDARTKIHLYFPKKSQPDVYQSRNLRGLPGVTLHPQVGSKHLMHDTGQSVFNFLDEVAVIEKIPFLMDLATDAPAAVAAEASADDETEINEAAEAEVGEAAEAEQKQEA